MGAVTGKYMQCPSEAHLCLHSHEQIPVLKQLLRLGACNGNSSPTLCMKSTSLTRTGLGRGCLCTTTP